jgi:hypothetical protein
MHPKHILILWYFLLGGNEEESTSRDEFPNALIGWVAQNRVGFGVDVVKTEEILILGFISS